MTPKRLRDAARLQARARLAAVVDFIIGHPDVDVAAREHASLARAALAKEDELEAYREGFQALELMTGADFRRYKASLEIAQMALTKAQALVIQSVQQELLPAAAARRKQRS